MESGALLASVDGVVMPVAEAVVPATDDGLLRGDGAFEVVRLYAGRPYALDEHLDRMVASAAALRLPFDRDLLAAEVAALLVAAQPGDAALRLVWTRGGRRIALLEPLPEIPATAALASVTYAPSRVLDGVKSLSYAANMLSLRIARERGADDALLVTPHGRVLEATTASFFLVADGRIVTPALGERILDSITRRRVLEVADVEERHVTLEEAKAADEAFLTSTFRELLPVGAIDDVALPAAPGPIGADLRRVLSERIAADLEAARR